MLFADARQDLAMERIPGNAIDVTERLAEALPGFLGGLHGSRLYLVPALPSSPSTPPSTRPAVARGGLSPGALRRCLLFVERELARPIPLHELAMQAGLSDCHFARAFKQSTGLPPHRYLLARRIEAALALIQGSDRSLTQVALEAGFCDQSHLCRAVARATGRTPRALRRECRGGAGQE